MLLPNIVPVEILTVNFVGWSAFPKMVSPINSTVNLLARAIVYAAATEAAPSIFIN